MRKKILIYTTRSPFPVLGGDANRVLGVVSALSEHYDVTLIVSGSLRDIDTDRGELAGKVRLKTFKSSSIFEKLYNIFSSVLRGNSLQQGLFFNRDINVWIEENQNDYDFMYFHLLRSFQPESKIEHARCIVDLTDCLSMAYQRLSLDIFSLKSWFFFFESFFIQKAEAKIAKLNLVRLFVSENDKTHYERMTGTFSGKNLIVQQGVSSSLIHAINYYSGDKLVLAFIGNMATLPNKDAVNYFLNEQWGFLRSITTVDFKIIGKVSEKDRRSWEKFEGVRCLGFVENIDEALVDVNLGVAPMRLGSGMQNKVLEFMKRGIPVVGSEMAFAGFDNLDYSDFVMRFQNNPHGLINLAKDHSRITRMSTQGLDYIERFGSWNIQLAPLIELVGQNDE